MYIPAMQKIADRILDVLKTHWTKMPEKEMAWVIFQIYNNIPLDKCHALVTEWYSKKGIMEDATSKWVCKYF